MRVVQVIPEFGLGGAEIMCENLVRELLERGAEVTVISLYRFESPITERMKRSGVDVVFLDKKPGPDLSMVFKICKVLKRVNADVVHSHCYALKYAAPAAVLAKVPVRVHTLHNLAKKENGWISRRLNALFFGFAGVHPITISQKCRESFVKEYRSYKGEIPVIFNGAELSRCIPKTDYAFHTEISILHVGRFAQAKNHSELLKAVKILHENDIRVKLRLVGEGKLKESVLKMVREFEMDTYVEFYGTTDDVFPLMAQADIFVLPSIYEGVPLSLIEAMGTGLPIVASPVGGIPELLTDGENGLLCEPTNDSITETVKRFIDDPALRAKCGENARISSERFSIEKMTDEYIRCYELPRDKRKA